MVWVTMRIENDETVNKGDTWMWENTHVLIKLSMLYWCKCDIKWNDN